MPPGVKSSAHLYKQAARMNTTIVFHRFPAPSARRTPLRVAQSVSISGLSPISLISRRASRVRFSSFRRIVSRTSLPSPSGTFSWNGLVIVSRAGVSHHPPLCFSDGSGVSLNAKRQNRRVEIAQFNRQPVEPSVRFQPPLECLCHIVIDAFRRAALFPARASRHR